LWPRGLVSLRQERQGFLEALDEAPGDGTSFFSRPGSGNTDDLPAIAADHLVRPDRLAARRLERDRLLGIELALLLALTTR